MTTPIDPTDGEAMGRIAYENNTILPGTIGTPATWDEMERWPEERIPWMSSGLAVARAVCPGHHAVYDTRTHRAVLMTDLRDLLLYADGGWGVEWDDIVDGAVDRTSRLLPEGWHPEDDEDRRSEWQATEKRCYESEVSR